jgi:hypothetical protein
MVSRLSIRVTYLSLAFHSPSSGRSAQDRVITAHTRTVNRITWHPTEENVVLSASQVGSLDSCMAHQDSLLAVVVVGRHCDRVPHWVVGCDHGAAVIIVSPWSSHERRDWSTASPGTPPRRTWCCPPRR